MTLACLGQPEVIPRLRLISVYSICGAPRIRSILWLSSVACATLLVTTLWEIKFKYTTCLDSQMLMNFMNTHLDGDEVMQARQCKVLEDSCDLPPQPDQAIDDEAVDDCVHDREREVGKCDSDVVRSRSVQAAGQLDDEMGPVLCEERHPAAVTAGPELFQRQPDAAR